MRSALDQIGKDNMKEKRLNIFALRIARYDILDSSQAYASSGNGSAPSKYKHLAHRRAAFYWV